MSLTTNQLAFYLGATCFLESLPQSEILTMYRITLSGKVWVSREEKLGTDVRAVPPEEVCPILRKMENITKEEAEELILQTTEFIPETLGVNYPGIIFQARHEKAGPGLRPRLFYHHIDFNALTPQQFAWFISRRFDVFGWIANGLAGELSSNRKTAAK